MDEQRLLDFFKTFADAKRIRIAARLIEQSQTTEALAQALNLHPGEVARHLGQFEKLGLLASADGLHRIDTKALETLSRETLAGHRPAAQAHSNDENADDFDRSVIKNYSLPDGRLREIPLQGRKFQSVLRHVVTVFTPGERYTEKQVNELLKRFHPDSATLRRGLVDHQMIQREANGSSYWREQQVE